MVAGLARKKKSQILYVDKLSDHLEALRKTTAELTAAIDRDAASYDAVMTAFKLPQSNPEEIQKREDAIQLATKGAAEVPLEVAKKERRPSRPLGTTGNNLTRIYEVRSPCGASNGSSGRKWRPRECGDQSR